MITDTSEPGAREMVIMSNFIGVIDEMPPEGQFMLVCFVLVVIPQKKR